MSTVFQILLALVEVAMVLATLIPLVRADAWWIRVFDFPRVQIVAIAAAALAIHGLVWPWGAGWPDLLAAILAGCLIYQAYRIRPYTPLHGKQVLDSHKPDNPAQLSLLVCNVLMDNRQARRCLDVVKAADADILLFVETDHWWLEQLEPLRQSHPHTVLEPLDNTYGMLLFSRLPIEDAKIEYLVEPEVPSIHGLLTLPTGDRVVLHCVHPKPPSPQEAEQSTERDAELVVVGKAVKLDRYPVIVAGDLNDVAWSHTSELFRRIGRLLDPRVGRGMHNSFHAEHRFLRWPLDHVFHSDHFKLLELRRLGHTGSDHFPIFIRLSLETEQRQLQESPQADEEDQAEAQETLEEAGVGGGKEH